MRLTNRLTNWPSSHVQYQNFTKRYYIFLLYEEQQSFMNASSLLEFFFPPWMPLQIQRASKGPPEAALKRVSYNWKWLLQRIILCILDTKRLIDQLGPKNVLSKMVIILWRELWYKMKISWYVSSHPSPCRSKYILTRASLLNDLIKFQHLHSKL